MGDPGSPPRESARPGDVAAVVVTATFKGEERDMLAARVEDYARRLGATGTFVEEVRVHHDG